MDYILDTHIAMWAIDDDERLSKEARDIISNLDNNIYFSALSVMEICIKHRKNPSIMKKTGTDLYEKCLEAGYYPMPLKPKHAIRLDDLNLKEGTYVNGDPFDRGLIAQAKQEKMILLSHDKIMENYDEPCIRMV